MKQQDTTVNIRPAYLLFTKKVVQVWGDTEENNANCPYHSRSSQCAMQTHPWHFISSNLNSAVTLTPLI